MAQIFHRRSNTVARAALFLVWAALLALLFMTWGAAQFDLGKWNMVVAMTIAVAKMLLVVLIFMHVRYGPRLIWIFRRGGVLLVLYNGELRDGGLCYKKLVGLLNTKLKVPNTEQKELLAIVESTRPQIVEER